jgi:hypothetical protein
MPIDVSVLSDVSVISVHDEEEPIHFYIPSVTPSRYEIPGVNAPQEIFKGCKFSFPGVKPIQYAFRRTKNNVPYVLIKIVEAKTFILGTEAQKLDEYGAKLSPDVMRVPVPVRMENIANEIERAHGKMGILAVRGEITDENVTEAVKRNVAFLQATVVDTNRNYKRSPLQVTPQARRRAWRLHELGLLTPMPEWAEINPDAKASEASPTMNCRNCGTLIRRTVTKCNCGVIYNWKAAVEDGLVKPADVPPSKRVEAGLEGDLIAQQTVDINIPVSPNAVGVMENVYVPESTEEAELIASVDQPDELAAAVAEAQAAAEVEQPVLEAEEESA